MRSLSMYTAVSVFCLVALSLSSCANYPIPSEKRVSNNSPTSVPVSSANKQPVVNYASRLPSHIDTNGRKTILVDPNVHAWGAYDGNGNLVRAGLATAGSNWCPDLGRACRTKAGTFHINSLGSASCKSTIYPLPRGGAPMPYCMFFNKNQGLHGSYNVVEGNVSHGCVRLQVQDAEWLRNNFASVGTKVIVKAY